MIEVREDNTAEILSKLKAAKHRGLVAIGMTAEKYAKKELYPGHGLDTGRLRNSITYAISGYATHVSSYRANNVAGGSKGKHARYEYGGGAMAGDADDAVFIGTNVEYATYVENGSRGRPGIHFLQSAANGHGAEYAGLLKESLENA